MFRVVTGGRGREGSSRERRPLPHYADLTEEFVASLLGPARQNLTPDQLTEWAASLLSLMSSGDTPAE